MKNSLLLAVFVILFTSLSFGQTWSWPPTDSISMDTTNFACGRTYEEGFTVHNNTVDTLQCRWKRIWPTGVNNIPSTWVICLGDPQTCWGASYMNYPHNYILNPHADGLFKFVVNPGNDTGYVELHVLTWVVNDSANTTKVIHFFYSVDTNFCVFGGINEVGVAQISMYPNPVKSTLTVNLPQAISNAKLGIYDLIGSKVFSKELNSREKEQEFDLSELDGGIYVARISENGKILTTRRFNKVD